MRTAEEIAERARGKYKTEYITQTNSVAVPIIERLSSEEQLHFVFFHENKGFRIFEPDGKERTPDHTSITGTTNKRFFLVTDERILYIVGENEEADDKIQEFDYDQIASVEGYESKGASIIEFSTMNGRKYKFVNNAWQTDTVQNAAKYINSQVDSTATEGSEEPAQENTPEPHPEQATPDSPGTKFCPDCGAEVEADDTFCTECGTSLDSETKKETESVERGSNLTDERRQKKTEEKQKASYPILSVFAAIIIARFGLSSLELGRPFEGFVVVTLAVLVVPRVRRRVDGVFESMTGWNLSSTLFKIVAGLFYAFLAVASAFNLIGEAANDPATPAVVGVLSVFVIFVLAVIIVYGVRFAK
jgi:hypothetical protein